MVDVGKLMDADDGCISAAVLHLEKVLDQARYMHSVLADIHDLSDPKSRFPLTNLTEIRHKSRVALEELERSGVLS